MRFITLFCLDIFVSVVSSAQNDPSSFTSIGDTSTSSMKDDSSDIDSSRYVKKPSAKINANKVKKQKRLPSDDEDKGTVGDTPDLQNAKVSPLPTLDGNSIENQPAPQPTNNLQKPSFGNKVRDMVLGGDLEVIDRYRTFLDSEDIRKNIFEFSAGVTYLYNTSTSPYFYRNYIDSAPGAIVGLDLWLTPFLGVDAGYRTTILNDIKDSPTQDTYDTVNQTWFNLGVKFRRFFGMAANAPSFVLGLNYVNYSLSAPPSASRSKQTTQGPELSVGLSVPSSRNYFGIYLDSFNRFSVIARPTGPWMCVLGKVIKLRELVQV